MTLTQNPYLRYIYGNLYFEVIAGSDMDLVSDFDKIGQI